MVTKTLKKTHEDVFSSREQPRETIPATTKMLKLVQDPCFGQKHEQVQQCSQCWVKHSCLVVFRNRKD